MNNKTIATVVIVIVVLIAGFFLLRGKRAGQNQVASESGKASMETQAGAGPTSLKSLLALGTSQSCTFTNEENGASSQGTVYVSGGKFRGDFQSEVQGKPSMMHMISDGQESYMWIDGTTSGYKMKFDATSQESAQSPASRGVDPNKNMDYKCGSWSADQSQFTLPTNIQFQDMTSMMGGVNAGSAAPGAPSGGKDLKTIQLQACASLSEPAKTQCEAAISGHQ